MRLTALVATLPVMIIHASASGQWVDFQDEIDTRLSLTTVGLDDPEEKDLGVGDFNQDGWDDLVIVRKLEFSDPGPRADVLLMNESGVLTDRTATYAPEFQTRLTDARDVFVGDFNGDGWLDLIIASTRGDQPTLYINQGEDEGVWQGFADESATRLPTITPPNQPDGPEFCAVSAGDIDGDDDLDIYFANYIHGGGTTDILLVNDGTGVFTNETETRVGEFANVAFGTSTEMHDVDHDGDLDLLKMSTLFSVEPFNDRGTFILFNDGNGVFNTVPYTTVGTGAPYMFLGGHFDDNEMIDVYFVDDGTDGCAFANATPVDGPLSFDFYTISPSPRTGGFGGNLHAADVDGDGDLDIGVCPIDVDIQNCDVGAEFTILENKGDRVFVDPYDAANDPPYALEAHDFAFIDINNDGCVDLFFGLCTGYALFMQTSCEPFNPAVTISLPAGAPIELERDEPTTFHVRLRDGAESPTGGLLHYSVDGGAYASTPLTPLEGVGGDLYNATFPPMSCGLSVEFYIEAVGDEGGSTTRPLDAPETTYEAIVGAAELIVGFDFEAADDEGWLVDVEGTDDATTGVWERVDPVGTAAQPEDDVDSAGVMCWVTGQHPGGGTGANDIDGGATTLFSPTFDLSEYGDARLVYARWYTNNAGDNPGEDLFIVEINDGSGWVQLEQVGPESPPASWETVSFELSAFIEMTSAVQVRFTASDLNNPSIVEAAIDQFRIEGLPCAGECPGDATGDFTVGLADLLDVLANWGSDGADGADVTGDGSVGLPDLLDVLANWGTTC